MSRVPSSAQLRLALGHDALDRRADLRTAGWSAVPEPRIWLLLDAEGSAAVRYTSDGVVQLAGVAEGGPAASAAPSSIPPTPALDEQGQPNEPDALAVLLGADPSGQIWCGRVVERHDQVVPADVAWVGLRDIALRLPDEQRSVLAEFLALANWHRTHLHCPRCGVGTVVAGLGWWRTCPADGSEHYPRTDPAVIALLLDDEDNALLGRQTRWPEGAFSTLAGFVEPGESAEAAVAREIGEEVRLPVTSARYVASQPWPFPASLMLGFHATVTGIRPVPQPDGVEIAEARWVDRGELAQLCQAHTVRLPGRLSIAYHLIQLWYGQPLPREWCRW